MSSSLINGLIVFFAVIGALVAFDAYSARRREARILAETTKSIEGVQGHSDAQIQESRKRTDAYQQRIFTLMEEHNALLREIVAELRSRGST